MKHNNAARATDDAGRFARPSVLAALGALAGAVIGGSLGAGWFALFGSDAEWFGEIAAALAGGVAGAVAAGSWGWCLSRWRTAPSVLRAGAVVGWILCGTLLVVGVVYIGGWTDADGPSAEATVGILGIPASVFGIWLISRALGHHAGLR